MLSPAAPRTGLASLLLVLAAFCTTRPGLGAELPLAQLGGKGLSAKARGQATTALTAIRCYRGCDGTLAECLRKRPRVSTAWRLARYVVFLAGKALAAEDIAKVIALRKDSVLPQKIERIDASTAPRVGPASARVVIVEYADFQCGHCQTTSPLLKRVAERFPKQVALHFKVYPLSLKGKALVAARAALAAQQLGRFWQMHDLLFAHPDQHDERGVQQLAQKAGLDAARFKAVFTDVALLKRIERLRIEGLRLGINRTPTLFVNGKRYRLRKDEMHLRERVEEELDLLAGK